jgi:hypothetical protein
LETTKRNAPLLGFFRGWFHFNLDDVLVCETLQ